MSVKSRRTAERSATTKKLNLISQIEEECDLSAMLKFLNNKRKILNELHEKIIEELDAATDKKDEKILQEIEEHSEFDSKILKGIAEVEKSLKKSIPKLDTINLEDEKLERKMNIRLPKIQLKKFTGNALEFNAFMEQFESAINGNTELSEIEKFCYLKNLLGDRASSAIKGLALSAANYSAAIEILKTRYGNKQVIISSHMEKLCNLEKVSSSSNTKDLRILYDRVEANMRSLQSLGINARNYGSLLVPILLARLPEDIRLIVSRACSSEDRAWELDDLLRGK